jgi:hypothetical protein
LTNTSSSQKTGSGISHIVRPRIIVRFSKCPIMTLRICHSNKQIRLCVLQILPKGKDDEEDRSGVSTMTEEAVEEELEIIITSKLQSFM